jgi:hypothetical protein
MDVLTQVKSKSGVIAGFIETYLPYGLSVKLILGALLTLLAGPGFLGYISDYATYYYAYNMGIRTPLEGVPYIKAAVTAASVFLLFASALIFALSIFLVNSSLNTIKNYFNTSEPILQRFAEFLHVKYKSSADYETTVQSIRSQGTWLKILFIVATSFLFSMLVGVTEYFLTYHNSNLGSGALLKLTREFFPVFIYVSAVLASLLFLRFLWKLAFALATAFIVMCLFFMFQPGHYASFLQVIGYGGGIPVSLTCKNDVSRIDICAGEKSLILRTNETLILLDKDRNVIFEVPREEFLYVRYNTGGLQMLKSQLPPYWNLLK